MKALTGLALISAVAVVSGCGGGSSSLPAQTVIPNTTLPATGSTAASFVVSVPLGPKKIASTERGAKYITSYVQGIDFSTFASNGQQAGYVFYPLTPQSNYCSTIGSNLVCTLQVAAPPGNDQFVVFTYDSPNLATAGVVSAATVNQTISANTSNVITAVTKPVPYTITLTNPTSNGTMHVGTGGSTPISATFADVDNLLLNTPFDAPINLSMTTSTPHYSLSRSNWSAPGDVVSIVNDGTTGSASLVLTFSGGSYAQANYNGLCLAAPNQNCVWPGSVSLSFTVVTP